MVPARTKWVKRMYNKGTFNFHQSPKQKSHMIYFQWLAIVGGIHDHHQSLAFDSQFFVQFCHLPAQRPKVQGRAQGDVLIKAFASNAKCY